MLKCRGLILFLFLFFSCSRVVEQVPEHPIEGRWPCFNGREIILQDGRYGLVTTAGIPVLPPKYDIIEFLDSDTAFLQKETESFLCDKNGRILARSENADSLRRVWPQIVEEWAEADRQSWELVVQRYERLLQGCKARRGQRLSRREFSSLVSLRNQMMEALSHTSGAPTASQKARLEDLFTQYRKAF